MSAVNQKEYLKKYLKIGKSHGTKKKRKKADNALGKRLKIIDDDMDVSLSEEIKEDLAGANEDAPQIVSIIDERPVSLKNELWKPIVEADSVVEARNASLSTGNFTKLEITRQGRKHLGHSSVGSSKPIPNISPTRIKSEYSLKRTGISPQGRETTPDYSPKRRRNSDSEDHSPRRQENSDSGDKSPPRRKNRISDYSPKQRKTCYSEDQSPRQQKNSEPDHSPKQRRRNSDSVDQSPRGQKNSEPDHSPKRRRRNNDSGDQSPRRQKNSELDHSPKRRRKNSDSGDQSPRRQKNGEADHSPKRRRRNSDSGDQSPRRQKNSEPDHSPKRRRRNSDSGDQSPRRRKNGEADHSPKRQRNSDQSPKRQRHGDQSPKRRKTADADHSPKRKKDSVTKDHLPDKKRGYDKRDRSPKIRKDEEYGYSHKNEKSRKDSARQKTSRWGDNSPNSPSASTAKAEKTLSGKKSGLQKAKDLIQELNSLKERENELFGKMTAEVSGVNAATITRKKKTTTPEEDAEKQRKQRELDEKYSRWGKGLKQVEDRDEKVAEQLHEMSKPLARYADDEDLERYQKEQLLDGDPMLAYMRKKKKKQAVEAGIPDKPVYMGDFMPNRYGIPPGYRWDGVDRSNGYEQKLFQAKNSEKASLEEAFMWNTEDM